jgi:hypothetical protein
MKKIAKVLGALSRRYHRKVLVSTIYLLGTCCYFLDENTKAFNRNEMSTYLLPGIYFGSLL